MLAILYQPVVVFILQHQVLNDASCRTGTTWRCQMHISPIHSLQQVPIMSDTVATKDMMEAKHLDRDTVHSGQYTLQSTVGHSTVVQHGAVQRGTSVFRRDELLQKRFFFLNRNYILIAPHIFYFPRKSPRRCLPALYRAVQVRIRRLQVTRQGVHTVTEIYHTNLINPQPNSSEAFSMMCHHHRHHEILIMSMLAVFFQATQGGQTENIHQQFGSLRFSQNVDRWAPDDAR